MTEIRSYRRVFDLERRIYRIDRFRLNPSGVPLRGFVYLVVCGALVAVLGHVTPAAELLGLLPWYGRFLALPALAAGVLTMIRVEGRTFHVAASAVVRQLAGAPRLVAFGRADADGACWQPPELVVLPDGSEGGRRLRYVGPGLVLVKARGVVLDAGDAARLDLHAAGGGRR